MSTVPGSSSSAPIAATEVPARKLAGGAKFAAVLIAIGPWIAAVSAGLQTFGFVAGLETPPLQRATHWMLFAVALGCAYAISRHLWRGVHDGRIAPVRLLLWSTLPVWLLAEVVGQYLAQYLLRAGNPYGFAEASMLRIAGQFMAWNLTGSVAYGLAIAAFLWRAPARRLPGIALAWASLAPLALFVAWILTTVQVDSLAVRSSLVAYVWVNMPLVLGLAGAALGDNARAHPRPDWLLGVGLGALLVFVAAAAVATGEVSIEAQVTQGDYGSRADSPANAIARVARMAWLGLPIAALPLVGFVARLRRWPVPAAWLLVALPFALLALALAIDAAGPGGEHGLDVAYPRRLNLLIAYAVAVPLAILALHRRLGNSDAVRDGLVLAAALFGLLWLAWRPGLLLLAPVSASPAALETERPLPPPPVDMSRPPPPPPPPPPPKLVNENVLPKIAMAQVLSGPEGDEAREGLPDDVGDVEAGGTIGGVAGGVIGGPPAAAPPPPPATVLVVTAAALQAQRIAGIQVQPPPELYAGQARTTLTVMLHVQAGGAVSRVELLRSSGIPELDSYVRSTLETWRFQPWMEQGRAVPVRAPITFNFVSQP
jgi:protein TonB